MLKCLTPNQEKLIIDNVVKACKDLNKLSKAGYNFLYLSSGFIAHYDKLGFISYYYTEDNLKRDILRNKQQNQWLNFTPKDRDYPYYKQKAKIYNSICERLENV